VAQDTQSKSLNISRVSCVKEALLVIHQNEEREQSRAMQKKKAKKKIKEKEHIM